MSAFLYYTRIIIPKTHDFVRRLIQSDKNEFDSAWLSTTMLKEIASKTGNRDEGYSVDYEDIFQSVGEEEIIPRNDVRLDISGTLSKNFLKVIRQDENIQRTMGSKRSGLPVVFQGRECLMMSATMGDSESSEENQLTII